MKVQRYYLFFNKNAATISLYNKIKSTESVRTFSSCVRTKPYFNFAVLFRIIPTALLYYTCQKLSSEM